MNAASNCDGGRYMPCPSKAWKNLLNRSLSQVLADSKSVTSLLVKNNVNIDPDRLTRTGTPAAAAAWIRPCSSCEPSDWRNAPHVAHHGLYDDAGDIVTAPLEFGFQCIRIIERKNCRQFGKTFGYAGAIGQAQCCDTGARFHKKTISMSVIAAVKLD